MFEGGAIHWHSDCDGWLYQRRGGVVRGAPPVPEGLARKSAAFNRQPRVFLASEPAARLCAGGAGQTAAHHGRHAPWARGRARLRPSRCGIWRWPCIRAAIRLRRAALRRIRRNADAGCRRFGQRQERVCRAARRAKRACRAFYVATMRVWDAESEKRVARHRDMRREKRFDTLECPLHLEKLDMPARGTALLEDMGNLAANELYDADGAKADAVSGDSARRGQACAQCAHLIIVSNEVFRGGRIMRAIRTRICWRWRRSTTRWRRGPENVCRVVCGIPKWVKGGNGLVVLETVCVAFAMFSALPVPHVDWNERNMRYAMAAFPVDRTVIGALWCVCGLMPLPEMVKAAGFCLIPLRRRAAFIWTALRIRPTRFPAMATGKEAVHLKDRHCGAFASDPPVRLFRAVFRALRLSAF